MLRRVFVYIHSKIVLSYPFSTAGVPEHEFFAELLGDGHQNRVQVIEKTLTFLHNAIPFVNSRGLRRDEVTQIHSRPDIVKSLSPSGGECVVRDLNLASYDNRLRPPSLNSGEPSQCEEENLFLLRFKATRRGALKKVI